MQGLRNILITEIEVKLSDKLEGKIHFKLWHYLLALGLAWLVLPFLPVFNAATEWVIIVLGLLSWLSYGVIGQSLRKNTRVNLVLIHRLFVFLYSVIAGVSLAFWYAGTQNKNDMFWLFFWISAVCIGLIFLLNLLSIIVQLMRRKDIKNMSNKELFK